MFTARRPRDARVEELLRRTLQRGTGHQSRHASDVLSAGEAVDYAVDPAGVNTDIVIGVGNDVPVCFIQAPIPTPRESQPRLEDVADPAIPSRDSRDHLGG
jgi:hypothetical protein